MENERMWEGPFEPGDPNGPALTNRAYQSNTVNLYTDGKEICAMIGPRPGTVALLDAQFPWLAGWGRPRIMMKTCLYHVQITAAQPGAGA